MISKILVIDDNPVIVRLDKSLLGSKHYEVLTALDGEEGLKMARERSPDIIFLDIILPGMHGFEVCKRLKEDPGTRHIPVIIVTGSGLEDIARNEPTLKADGYIKKPYGLDELMKAIEEVEKRS